MLFNCAEKGTILVILLTTSLSAANIEQFLLAKAERCSEEKCQPPNCRCSGLPLPKSEFAGREREIPQLVTVTFDDAVTATNYEQYQALFEGLTNPDQCASRGTFFVSHEYTDYSKVNALYAQGHEIALHSVSHGNGTEYWRNASVELIMQEFGNQIDMLETYAKVNRKDIRGMRLPFLQIAGNNSYVAAKRLGLMYDNSMPTLRYKSPPMWPYTLDYLSVQDCQIEPCPDAAVPGMWVNPMVTWNDFGGYSCAMIDACIFLPPDEVDPLYDWMWKNFVRHYEANRAPFGMYLHAAWFLRGTNYFAALRKFLQHLNELPDVYITTESQVIDYMQNPVLGKPFEDCIKPPLTNCHPVSCPLRKLQTNEMRYLTLCDQCPEVYPWLNNSLSAKKSWVHKLVLN